MALIHTNTMLISQWGIIIMLLLSDAALCRLMLDIEERMSNWLFITLGEEITTRLLNQLARDKMSHRKNCTQFSCKFSDINFSPI